MSRRLHSPKQFFLISTGNCTPLKAASPQAMGGKAYNLLVMAHLGLPVPTALVIGTQYTQAPNSSLLALSQWGLPELQAATGLVLGDERQPLIVSVRSGAPVSMPGMLDTLLNVGLCDRTVGGLLRQSGNPRMVWDAYRRLIATFGTVVADIPYASFEQALRACAGERDERELDFAEHRALVRQYLDIYLNESGSDFPQHPHEQLNAAVLAVFKSWNQPKAQAYRQIHGLNEQMGTAVTIQRMVFGNTGCYSGAGVGFTRNPMTGANELWVDYLVNAQGEDVVGGHRNAQGDEALVRSVPLAYEGLKRAATLLERHFGDMQDLEFTVQDGELFMLQTRCGKRTLAAATRIALDLLDEGLIDRAQALERTAQVTEQDLALTRLASLGGLSDAWLASAESASSGVVWGEIALDAERVAARVRGGVPAILVRTDALTDDIAALHEAKGLLTRNGARTSHAAVVARQLGKVCLVGCEEMRVEMGRRELHFGNTRLSEGDVITLDGTQGKIFAGRMEMVSEPDQALWARVLALRAATPALSHTQPKKPRQHQD